ncbi:class I SAM-dependent methyltransferase [Aerolutibacter ruishenii]|uniref:Cyclopropane fatty-acyl-phospholipid synthase-like methyltransferase n=1 Tax=Aerolutibacter ruishenii TaxID=686800 RepID=A0A562M2T3_9GAMM|nr:class I SAM-dependent methyltransferase [Lysobacter ruishenii]TWI14257.1 cyclopropane fatty-acyl-phospholipid synthase-like methyltransferase [Lysobacter ruishenii]
MSRSNVACPVCEAGASAPYAVVDGYPYYLCGGCGSIHIAPEVIADMDAGVALVGEYASEYWEQERAGALERAAGASLCRAGEAILYCRRPVHRFLDVGAGPGFLLCKLQELLDTNGEVFHGVEKFPPPYAVHGTNFHVGSVDELEGTFDAGVCIEVVEHLTPKMLDDLVSGIARVSAPGSFWLFNTGMPEYVRNEDPAYLDPLRRGHIISYSLRAVSAIFARHGLRVGGLPGKSFAFCAEYQPSESPTFDERIYQPVAENEDLLRRNELFYYAAFETARSYLYFAEYQERTRWALSLQGALQAANLGC